MYIESKRLLIRDLTYDDSDDFFQYGKTEWVGPNAGWKPFPNKTIANRVLTSQMISKECYAIALKDSNRLIGTISLYHTSIRKYNKAMSLGFSLNYDYWGQGFMTEAVQEMIHYTFTKTDCEVLEVGHHVDNYGCKRVVEKSGFHYDGRFSKYKRLYDGRIVDADFYSILKEEYERGKKR